MTPSRRSVLKQFGAGGVFSLAGCLSVFQTEPDLPGRLAVEWESETATAYSENHHALSVTLVDDQPVIGLPRNDLDGSEHCGVVALDGSGDVLWSDPLPPDECNAHAIGDIGIGDLTGDQRPEFLAATETQGVFAYDAMTGEETFQGDLLDSIGYSAPVATDLDGDGSPSLVVVDFAGNLTVARADGAIEWTRHLGQPVYVTPIVADLTGDGAPNLAVNFGRHPSVVACFSSDGAVQWRTGQTHPSLSWALVDRGGDPAIAAASGDALVLIAGTTGERDWSTTLARDVAVGGADDDHVYVSARDGAVRAVGIDDGDVRWSSPVTEDVRMAAPGLGAVADGSGRTVVAATYDGTLAVLDAESGEMLARRTTDVSLYSQPLAVDVTGDGTDDVLVLYGDGRVAALSYEA